MKHVRAQMSAAINSLILMIFSFLSSSKNGPHEKQDTRTSRHETSIRLESWRAGSLVGWWAGRLMGWWADALEAGRLEGWRAGGLVRWWSGGLEDWKDGGLVGWGLG